VIGAVPLSRWNGPTAINTMGTKLTRDTKQQIGFVSFVIFVTSC
jgi:hypothetical protein